MLECSCGVVVVSLYLSGGSTLKWGVWWDFCLLYDADSSELLELGALNVDKGDSVLDMSSSPPPCMAGIEDPLWSETS